MFVLTLTYVRPLEEVEALLPAHMAWLEKHFAEGLFVASGRRIPRTGGVILARSGNAARVQAAADADPFVTGGVARCEVVEFTPTMAAPGLEALKGA